MLKHIFLLSAGLIFFHCSSAEIYTARNSGMGGVGVASSLFDAASFTNPALLSQANTSQNVGIVLPSIGGEASDKYDVIDTLEKMEDLFDEFEIVVNVATLDLTRAAELEGEIISDLNAVDEKPIIGEGSAIFAIAVPQEKFSWAFDRRISVLGVAQLNFDPNDETVLNVAVLNQDPDELDNIQSSASASGVVITETVISLAKPFSTSRGHFSVGVSPKVYHIDTYFYSQRANDVDTGDIEREDYLKDYTNINLDIGLAYYPSYPANDWTIGLVLRDLIRHDYRTVTTNGERDIYETQLSATAGIANKSAYYTAALDVDILPVKGLKSVADSQFLRAGVELDAFGWAQLRLGVRLDIQGVRDNAMTAGINLSPYKTVHIGLSGWTGDMWNGDSDTYGGAVDFKLWL